ncbi:MAG: sugar phosphate nucleotidyltransferase, partial [Thermoplasmata archaeon]
SRGLRKEFLPLYDRGSNGEPVLKPIAHLVVESMMAAGVSEITLVVQPRDLSLVREYFSVDPAFLARHDRHPERLAETRDFYAKLRHLRVGYALQPEPVGFGDAVLRAAPFVGPEPFLLQASDGVVIERVRGGVLRAMGELLRAEGLDAVLLVRQVPDPRHFGVVEGRLAGRYGPWRRVAVERMVEKPAHPRSRWAATAAYAFSPGLFTALRTARRRLSPGAELELTSGIQELLRHDGKVAALILEPATNWRSVGSPEGYLRALRATHART